MSEVFGYSAAHKDTGERLLTLSRKVYDSKSAASGGLTRVKKCYMRDARHFSEQERARYYYDQNPEDFVVVELIACPR